MMTAAKYRVPTAALNAFLAGRAECLGWRLVGRRPPLRRGGLPVFVVRRTEGDARRLAVPYYGRPWAGDSVVGDPLPDDWKRQWDQDYEMRARFHGEQEWTDAAPLQIKGLQRAEGPKCNEV